MAKYIYKSNNDTTLEVTKCVEGKSVINFKIINDEGELSHKLTENQLHQLKLQLDNYYKDYQANKPLIAKVSFYGIDGSKINKQYNFLTNIRTLQQGDYLVVDSLGKECVAKFIKYIHSPNIYPTKWVIKKHKPPYKTDSNVYIIPPKKEELTKEGFTNRIRISKEQTVESLIEYGFTNHHEPVLYFCRVVGKDITLNLSVNKDTLTIKGIDVIDEDFLQPYDYQSMILKGKSSDMAVNVYHKVNDILSKLQYEGIITGFEKGMYI